MGFYVSFGWLGQHFIGGRSVVARFLFMLENPSCGQQSFESGSIESGALAHAEIASIDECSSSKNGHDGIRFTLPRENVFGELPTSALFWSVSADDPVTTSRFYPHKPECGK